MPSPSLFNPRGKSVAIMGILNLSPDSFYAKSRAETEDQALQMAECMIQEGADLLDVGAVSTRPGAKPISAELELDRLLPVVSRLCKQYNVPVSVDTCNVQVAERVLQAGATVINDITGLQKDRRMAEIISRYNAGVVIMHMQGTPETMQERPVYRDLIGDITKFLRQSIDIAEGVGIAPERIAVDPGIGFGKTPEHNLELVARLDRFKVLDKPILLGVSRKSFIGKILELPTEERLEGSLAAAVIGVMKGASLLRVHDVRATLRAVKVAESIMQFDKETE